MVSTVQSVSVVGQVGTAVGFWPLLISLIAALGSVAGAVIYGVFAYRLCKVQQDGLKLQEAIANRSLEREQATIDWRQMVLELIPSGPSVVLKATLRNPGNSTFRVVQFCLHLEFSEISNPNEDYLRTLRWPQPTSPKQNTLGCNCQVYRPGDDAAEIRATTPQSFRVVAHPSRDWDRKKWPFGLSTRVVYEVAGRQQREWLAFWVVPGPSDRDDTVANLNLVCNLDHEHSRSS